MHHRGITPPASNPDGLGGGGLPPLLEDCTSTVFSQQVLGVLPGGFRRVRFVTVNGRGVQEFTRVLSPEAFRRVCS